MNLFGTELASDPVSSSGPPKHPASYAENADAALDAKQWQLFREREWENSSYRRERNVPDPLSPQKLHDPHQQGGGIRDEDSSLRAHVWSAQGKKWIDEVSAGEAA